MADIIARARAYLSSLPKDDGRTFYADHPEVIIAELVAELVEARANEDDGLAWDVLKKCKELRKADVVALSASQAEAERLKVAMLDMVDRAKNHIVASAYAENPNEFNAGYKGAAEAIHLEVSWVANAALNPETAP